MPTFRYLTTRPGTFFKSLQELTAREQEHLTSEIVKVRGLMPPLIKQRNDLLALPALAWWLDRRRNRDRAGPAVPR
jgi:hypothetical protein